jgi:hypothetical protein
MINNFYKKFFLLVILSLFFYSSAFASIMGKPMSNSGLVGYWNFEDAKGGNKTYDRSGLGSNGTLNNMDLFGSWVTSSTTGQALTFDGSNDYVDITNLTSNTYFLDTTSTFSFWIKTTQTSTGEIIGKRGGVGSGGLDIVINNTPSDGFISAYTRNATGGIILSRTQSTGVINDGTWHHVVIIITTNSTSFSNQNIDIYIDGVLNEGSLTNIAVPGFTADSIKFGGRVTINNTYYQGSLDEVRLYGRGLSTDEISRLYKLQKPKFSSGLTTSGLVGYWPLDEGVGTRAEDMSANNNNGTLVGGPTWGAGRNGKAISFNGNGNYINLGSSSSINTSVFTYSAWIYNTGANQGSVQQGIIGSSSNGGPEWRLEGGAPAVMGLLKQGVANIGTSNSNIPINTWTHVAVTYDSAGNYVFYKNGVLDGSGTSLQSFSFSNLQIGLGFPGGSGDYFNGTIDDVRVYKRVLTVTEISNLYKGSRASIANKSKPERISNGLVGYWTFDANKIYGTTVYDSSSGGNNGTMTNGPVPTNGKVGQALNFSSVDDYVLVPSSTIYNNANMTICAWVYPTANVSSVHIASRLGVAASGDWRFGIGAAGGTWRFRVQTSAGQSSAESSTGFNLNSWQYVCGIYNGNNVVLYVNGAQTNSVSNVGSMGSTNVDVWIGNASTNEDFTGKIDDVRIYNRALSDDELKALYNMGK